MWPSTTVSDIRVPEERCDLPYAHIYVSKIQKLMNKLIKMSIDHTEDN